MWTEVINCSFPSWVTTGTPHRPADKTSTDPRSPILTPVSQVEFVPGFSKQTLGVTFFSDSLLSLKVEQQRKLGSVMGSD